MDEQREAEMELEALDRKAADEAREQEAEDRYWTDLADQAYAEWREAERRAMPDAKPFPKSQQLARGERRYRRKVASPKQWQALQEAKRGSCRVCGQRLASSLHHVVPRDFHGDDIADNLTPLCFNCHLVVTLREPEACEALCASLSDAEYAYAVQKGGEAVFERVYGIRYGR